MPGDQCARGLACEIKKHTSVVTTVTPEITRHSPRNGFTAYFVLSPVSEFFVVTVVGGILPANLAPATGVGTTRLYFGIR